MKSFLRTMIIIFSIIIVIVSIVSLLIVSEMVSLGTINNVLVRVISSQTISTVTYGISVVFSILAIVCIFNSDTLSSSVKGGIILPAEIGVVQISNQTFENIIVNVTKKYAGIKTAKVEVKVSEEGLMADIFAYVLQDTVISDITAKLQEDIKDTVIKQTTVAVKNVNVKIKGTYTLAEPKE